MPSTKGGRCLGQLGVWGECSQCSFSFFSNLQSYQTLYSSLFSQKGSSTKFCILRARQGNWGLKCAAVQNRALKLYPELYPGVGQLGYVIVKFGYIRINWVRLGQARLHLVRYGQARLCLVRLVSRFEVAYDPISCQKYNPNAHFLTF